MTKEVRDVQMGEMLRETWELTRSAVNKLLENEKIRSLIMNVLQVDGGGIAVLGKLQEGGLGIREVIKSRLMFQLPENAETNMITWLVDFIPPGIKEVFGVTTMIIGFLGEHDLRGGVSRGRILRAYMRSMFAHQQDV